jgi:hypothetical protein
MMLLIHVPSSRPPPDPLFWRGVRNALVMMVVMVALVAAIWWLP